MPNLVDQSDLPQANSLFQTVDNATWLLGPLLGGVLLAAWGPDVPYVINAATFLLSALLVARIPAQRLQAEAGPTRGHWQDLAEGFAVVRRSRAVLTVAVAWTIVMFGNAGVNVAVVFLVREELDAGNAALGLTMGAAGFGLVLGSALAGPWLERRPIALVYGTALTLMAAGFGVAAVAPELWLALPAVVVGGFGNGLASVCNPLLVQQGVPDRVRGRVFTVVMSVNFAFMGLGMAVAGPLTDAVGPRWVWGGAAMLFLVAAAIGAALARGVGVAGRPEGEQLLAAAAGAQVIEPDPVKQAL
jgi:predicted MFS family arabinose efflux permease